MASRGTILIVADQSTSDHLRGLLTREGHRVHVEGSTAAALACLDDVEPDAILTDFWADGIDGVELCLRVAARHPELPVVMLAAHTTVDSAVAALRARAHDVLTKPLDPNLLVLTVARAVRHHRLRSGVSPHRRVSPLPTTPETDPPVGPMIGRSRMMREAFEIIERAAQSEAPVLIVGERGTGKELVARSLHARGRRSRGPFVMFDCMAYGPGQLELELFGHARGDSTRTAEARDGALVRATGGTLFLDAIGALFADVQAELLQTLQQRRVHPLGSTRGHPLDVRLVAASDRELTLDLDPDLGLGLDEEADPFRQDLLCCIDVLRVDLPPLRMRGRDVLLLTHAFIERYAARHSRDVRGIEPEVAELLLRYDWPGNVRELKNCMERAVVLASGETIGVDDLPHRMRSHA